MNKVIVMGNLGADPELRYTAGGAAVCQLSLATNRSYTKADGNKVKETEWHRIVVWGKQAENCKEYLQKGRQLLVEGRLHTRKWEDKTGQTRYTTEIVANQVQFLAGGRNDQRVQQNTESTSSELPFEDSQEEVQNEVRAGAGSRF